MKTHSTMSAISRFTLAKWLTKWETFVWLRDVWKEMLSWNPGRHSVSLYREGKRPFHRTYLRFSGNDSMKVLFLRLTKDRITSRNHSHKSWHVGAPCMNMAPQRWVRMSLHSILGTTVCIYIFIEVATWKQGLCISEMLRSRKANMWEKLIKDNPWIVSVCYMELSGVAMWLTKVQLCFWRWEFPSFLAEGSGWQQLFLHWSFSSQLMPNSPSL